MSEVAKGISGIQDATGASIRIVENATGPCRGRDGGDLRSLNEVTWLESSAKGAAPDCRVGSYACTRI